MEKCNIADEANCINFYVCENHFQKSDYTNHLQERLKYQTVPKPANTSQFTLPNDEALLRPSCSHTDNSTFSHHAPSSNTTNVNITISTLSSDTTDINSKRECSSNTGDGLLLTSTDHDYCKIDSQCFQVIYDN
jgi:hypothetical protein